MNKDKTIFGLRFRTNDALVPSPGDLEAFLEQPKKGSPGTHGDDLAVHRDLLGAVESRERGNRDSVRNWMLCGVLKHSQFVKPAFKLAVEQYKYHLHTLAGLDFRKPATFIKSAEEELSRLNSRKQEEAVRKERLLAMVEERQKALVALKKTQTDLAEELTNIIDYVAESLDGVARLCEASITLLVSEQIDRKKELDLIEDIKTHFKERLRDSLHQGTITREQMEEAKQEVATLSKWTADLMRTDVYALNQLYEAIHEQAGSAAGALQVVVQKIGGLSDKAGDDALSLYGEAESILVSVVSGCHLEVKAPDYAAQTENDRLLVEKRTEMQNYLFGLLEKVRSS